jgi:hypothetical protein
MAEPLAALVSSSIYGREQPLERIGLALAQASTGKASPCSPRRGGGRRAAHCPPSNARAGLLVLRASIYEQDRST